MDAVDFRANIKKYYDEEAVLRDSKTIKADWKTAVRSDFCALIKYEDKKTLLELGAGAGYDSRFFTDSGLAVTAVDISSEMVKKCKEKSIEAYELDFYNLADLNRSFDCVYAINTLLHVPKTDLPDVLKGINSVLNPQGLFYMGVYGGEDSESEFVKIEVSDAPRYFSFYSEETLKAMLKKEFEIISFESFAVGDGNEIFRSITLRKR